VELAQQVQENREQDRIGQMAITGILAGAAGLAVGWYGGVALTNSEAGGLLMSAALESAAVPWGVYVGNGRQGEYYLASLASYGIGLIGAVWIGSQWTDSSVQTGVLVFPLAQLVASIWIVSKGMR
jgi:hypothetical protein